MIDLSPNTYIYGIWFCYGDDTDWMACLSKKLDGPWTFQYRHRYYADDKAFDSEDRKSWYSWKGQDGTDESLQKFLGGIGTVTEAIEAQYGNPMDFIQLECLGSDEKVFFEMGSRPWSNMKMISKEEAIAEGYVDNDAE